MKKVLTTLLVIFLIGGIFAGGVLAQGPNHHMNRGPYRSGYDNQRDYRDGYQRIDLSEEQLNEIADLREEFYNESEGLRAELRSLNRELMDLEFRRASYEEIDKVEAEIDDVLSELDDKRLAHQKNIESVLTEEQLNIVEENRYQAEERYNNRYDGRFDSRNNYGHHGAGRRDWGDRRNSYDRYDDYGYRYGHGMMGMMGMMGRGRGMMGRGFPGSNYGYGGHHRGRGFGPGWCY